MFGYSRKAFFASASSGAPPGKWHKGEENWPRLRNAKKSAKTIRIIEIPCLYCAPLDNRKRLIKASAMENSYSWKKRRISIKELKIKIYSKKRKIQLSSRQSAILKKVK